MSLLTTILQHHLPVYGTGIPGLVEEYASVIPHLSRMFVISGGMRWLDGDSIRYNKQVWLYKPGTCQVMDDSPDSDTWIRLPDPPEYNRSTGFQRLGNHATCLHNGKLFLIAQSKILNTKLHFCVLDLWTLEWTTLKPPSVDYPVYPNQLISNIGRSRLYFISQPYRRNPSCFVYDTINHVWIGHSETNSLRYAFGSVFYNDRLMIFGGVSSDHERLDSVETCDSDPVKGEWKAEDGLPYIPCSCYGMIVTNQQGENVVWAVSTNMYFQFSTTEYNGKEWSVIEDQTLESIDEDMDNAHNDEDWSRIDCCRSLPADRRVILIHKHIGNFVLYHTTRKCFRQVGNKPEEYSKVFDIHISNN